MAIVRSVALAAACGGVLAAGLALLAAWEVLRRPATAARVAAAAVRRAVTSDGELAFLTAAELRQLRDGVARAVGLPPSDELARDLVLHATDLLDVVGEVEARVAAAPRRLTGALAELGDVRRRFVARAAAAGAAVGLVAGAGVTAAEPGMAVGLLGGAAAAFVGARAAVAALTVDLPHAAAVRLAAQLLPPDALLDALLTGPRAARFLALVRRHHAPMTAGDVVPAARAGRGGERQPATVAKVVAVRVEHAIAGADTASGRPRAGWTPVTATVGALLGAALALAAVWPT